MKASIVIVTRNRAEQLRATLDSLNQVAVPEGVDCELLLIDNGSDDHSADVMRSFDGKGIVVRQIFEEKRGKSSGMNRAFGEARGEIILSVDDDVRFPPDWIERMIEPIADGHADAVAGGVVLAPELVREWMTPMHRSWLADTLWLERRVPRSYVGANMAIARHVLERVPGYDTELGPGGYGYCDDVLFSTQLRHAGYRIADRLDVCVVHHPDEHRLTRCSWLDAAWSRGLSQAYVGHHWEHWGCRLGWLKLARAKARLKLWRMTHPRWVDADGCDQDEMRLVFELATVAGHLNESKRRRNYEKNGLIRRKVGGHE